jgi:hypothetical protein
VRFRGTRRDGPIGDIACATIRALVEAAATPSFAGICGLIAIFQLDAGFVERLAQLGNKEGRLARSLRLGNAKVEKAKYRSEHHQLHDPKARTRMPEEVLVFGNGQDADTGCVQQNDNSERQRQEAILP